LLNMKIIKKLFQEEKLPKSEQQQFQNEITEINFNRMGTVTGFMIFLFPLLLLLDYYNFKSGLWQTVFAYKLIFILHCSALFFSALFKMYLFYKKSTHNKPDSFQVKLLLMITVNLFLMHLSAISFCDVHISGSTAAYLGAVFAVAAFFILPTAYRLAVFIFNLLFMTALLLLASKQTGILLSNQIINVAIYSVFAFILSGMLCRYQQKDFINRRKIQMQTRALEELAMNDSLTGIMNRRHFLTEIDKEMTRSQRHGHDLSLAIFDVDHFKNVNDKYGHLTGDKVLVSLCRLIQDNIRPHDIFSRWGGEEFILLSPDTNAALMADLCERLREMIANHAEEGLPPITASFGLSDYHTGDSIEGMIQRADVALYKAKYGGRNCIRS
jgi:diguanylate cyclase (GGDEF)-like protein